MLKIYGNRKHCEYNSCEREGFSDLLQQALRDRIETKLVIATVTSLITDGPASYTCS